MPRHDMMGEMVAAMMGGEHTPAKPAPNEYIKELSDAIDSLLGIIAMIQEDKVLDDQALAALEDLAKAAEKAVSELDRVVGGGLPESPAEEGEEGFRPAKPVLNVPVTKGANSRAVVIRARTPSYGLREE